MDNRVKIQYRKPLLELCSPNKKIETVLTDRTQMSAYNITLVEKINETAELTFCMPFENNKINDQDCEKLVKLNGEYYVIKEISVSDANSRVIEVKCIHESVELKGVLCETIDVIGVTVAEMFQAIKDSCTTIDIGYEFRGTDIPDTTKRALQNDSEVSVYENLVKMAEVFQAVLEFSVSADGIKQVYLRKGSIKRGKYLKKSNGLKQLDLTYDSNELFTRVIAFGYTDSDGVELNIMGVNPTGKSYVENYDYFLAKGMTYDEIKNNPRCNQEMIYRDTNIVDENDLYRLAMEELEKCSVPVLDGTIDMVDFSVFEGSALLAPVLCEEIIVIDKDINFSIKAKITGIERNYDNPLQTKVTISNVVRYTSVFKDLVHQGEKIDKITSTDGSGNLVVNGSYVNGKIDAHKAQIVGMLDSIEKPEDKYAILFEDRRVGSTLFGALAIGSRGILIANELDGKDEWIWRTAINANAISASEINTGVLNADLIKAGVLESFNGKTWIDMEDGSFSFANGRIVYNNTDGFKIFLSSDPEVSDLETELNKYKNEISTDIKVINDKLDNIDIEFGDAFADGIIDEAEASMIKRKLTDLNQEKADIDSRYSTIYNNVNLLNPAKSNLYNAYNSFVVKHGNLVSITENIIADGLATVTEREQFDKALDEYIKTTPTLSEAFDDAVTNISYNMTTGQINDFNTLVQEDIKNVSDSVGALEDTMNNSFRDGIIDEAEYMAITESMSRLQTEKTDIDKNFDNLYNNLNLRDTAKTNLKNKYDAYVLAHNTLMNYVNNSIADKVASDEEKAEIERLLAVYNEALAEFGVAQTEAINNIADNSANDKLLEYKQEVNKDIKDINEKINNLKDDVGGVIADGIIEEAETIIIQNSIKELDKEKKDIDVRYNEIYNNSGLSKSGKQSLKTAYTEYTTAHTTLINQINNMIEDKVAIPSEKAEYEKCIEAYSDKFSALSKAFDNALSEIASNNANTIMEALRSELQGNIRDVEETANALKEQLGGFTADGILDEAEKQSIRMMLKTLTTEKSDITNQYNTVYSNADLTGTAKSNLSTAYINYNSGYNTLITVINSLLSKDTISASDKSTLDTAFIKHDEYLAVYSTRVNEAIDAIAKKKKEDAIQSAKEYYDTQIIIDKKGILSTVSSTYSTKQDVENLNTQLSNKIQTDLNNLNIGGRNYIKDYKFQRQDIWSKSSASIDNTNNYGILNTTTGASQLYQRYNNNEFKVGDTLTIQYEIKCEDVAQNTSTTQTFRVGTFLTAYNDTTYVKELVTFSDHTEEVNNFSDWTKVVKTGTVASGEFNNTILRLYARNFTGKVYFRNIKLEKGNKATDLSPAPEDTETYTDNLVADLQEQLDGKIETWSQQNDPSTEWTTTEEKKKHEGDIWYNTSTKLTYRWSGSAWTLLENKEAQDASALAQKKAQVFTGTPTVPYYKGDLWVTSTTAGKGVVKTCITARTTGSYTASDWVENLKYTDNTAITNFINNTYSNDLINIKNQIDGKVNAYYQTSQPHPNYTNVANNETYNAWVGDLWYNSDSTVKKTYIYTKTANGSNYNYQWQQQEIPTDMFDMIDGKKSIYSSKPSKYYKDDLWILESDTVHTAGKKGEILTATSNSTSYNASHWAKKVAYTDDTLASKIQTDLNNLNIGGRNYVRDYKFQRQDIWQKQNGSTIDNENNCGILNASTDPVVLYQNFDKGVFNSGDVLTLQFEIKCEDVSANTGSLSFILRPSLTAYNDNGGSGAYVADVAIFKNLETEVGNYSDWTKIVATKTISNNTFDFTKFRLYCRNFTGKVYFRNIKLEKGNRATDLSPAPEDTEMYTDNLVADLQEQLDGKIETYSQDVDPSTNWTTDVLKNIHKGDIWYKIGDKKTYRWNGTSWTLLENKEAQDASALAQKKAQVFTGTPTVPYYKGDLWVTSTTAGKGVVKTCITARTTGSYTASDWVENLKYTDNTLANQLQNELNNLSIGGRNLVKNSAFLLGKGSWTFGNNVTLDTSKTFNGHPSAKTAQSGLTTNSYRGAITYNLSQTTFEKGEVCTISCYYYVEDKSTIDSSLALEFKGTKLGETQEQSSAIASYLVVPSDIVEGSWTRIYKTFTMPYTYEKCCIRGHLVKNGTAWFTDFELEKGNKLTDWTSAVEDTETYVDNLVADLQEQVDGKIQTWSQQNDPSTEWTTTEEKNKHEGDIWYNTSTKLTYRWSGSAWVKLSSQEAIDASNLAKSKAQIFTKKPTIPYYVGDLWITALDGTGVVKTCKTERTSGNFTDTDWVESLKYTDNTLANQLQNELNNLSIGGRNYIQFSDFKTNTNQWIQSKHSENTGTTTVGDGVMTIISSGNGYIQRQIYSNRTATALNELEKNKTYTLSVEIMMETVGTGTNAGIDLRFNKLDNSISTQIRATQDLSKLTPNVWTKIQKTATINWNDTEFDYWRVVIQGALGQTIHFRKPKLELGNKATDWTSAVEDTETYIDNLVIDLQHQIDGKIETYSQSTDPSTYWTTEDVKLQHEGDLWYNTSTSKTYRWNGTSWVYQPEAEEVAKTKKRIFTTTPKVPYDIGDLWILQSDTAHSAGKKGEILTCSTARSSGSYTTSDWTKTITYTDDTAITNFINNTYSNDLINIKDQIDGKVNAYYQTSQPHPNYTNVANNETYNAWVGDLWYNSDSTVKKTYIYTKTANGSNYNYQWQQQEIPADMFDIIDGKKSIYSSKPSKYYKDDLWILESDTVHTAGKKGHILTATSNSTSYNASHWAKKVAYTDDSYAKNVESKFEQRADSIEASVTSLQTTTEGFINKTTSSISVLQGQIESKVDANGVNSVIKQNPESIKIGFNGISDNASMSAEGLTLKNGYFKVLDKNGTQIAYIGQDNWMRLQGLQVYGSGQCFQNVGTGVRSLIITSTDNKSTHIDFNSATPTTSNPYSVRIMREGNSSQLSILASSLTLQSTKANSTQNLEIRSQNGATFIDFTSNATDDYHTRLITYGNEGNLHFVSRDSTGSFIVNGALRVTGSKNCIQETKNYGRVAFYAVEDCESYFTDTCTETLTVDNSNQRVVLIDTAFKECVNTELPYIVDIHKVGWGDYRILEQTKDYFIVESDRSDFTFKYTIKGKRRGYENERLEQIYENERDEIVKTKQK